MSRPTSAKQASRVARTSLHAELLVEGAALCAGTPPGSPPGAVQPGSRPWSAQTRLVQDLATPQSTWREEVPKREAHSLVKATRAALEAQMQADEVERDKASGSLDRIGEVGRLLRRYALQPQPQQLDLSHSLQSVDQVAALADVLLQLPQLTSLMLAGNDLTDQAFSLLAPVLSAPAAAGLLQLDLGRNKLTASSMQALANLVGAPPPLAAWPRTSPPRTTSSAEIHPLPPPPTSSPGLPPLSHHPQPGSSTAAQANPATQADQTDGRVHAGAGLPQQQQQQGAPLAMATPHGVSWPDSQAGPAAGAGAGPGAGGRLPTAPRPQRAQLNRLVLSGNEGVGDTGMALLVAAMVQPGCKVQQLEVAHCGLTERSGPTLQRLLQGCRSLELLDVSWNVLGRRGSQPLALGLRAAPRLATLRMAWTGLGDQGSAHIVAALRHNKALQSLDLSGNRVSEDTCLVLIEALRVNTSLQHLVMRDNPLGMAWARRLLRSVHQGVLGKLDLMGCTTPLLQALLRRWGQVLRCSTLMNLMAPTTWT
ncbi:hypothetical protein V8C86DRAFT_1341316 [Haematococcus lacustris]